MAFLFGGGDDSASSGASRDPIRCYQDELYKGCRTLDREDFKAGHQEKELRDSITRYARAQRYDMCRIKAKELIRLREHRKRLVTTRGHMSSLIQQLSTVHGTKTLHSVMAKTTKLLQSVNTKIMDPIAVQRMLHEFERQSNAMQDSKETLEESMDDIFQSEGEDDAMDDAMSSIFAELRIDADAALLRSASVSTTKNVSAGMMGTNSLDQHFEARLAKLKSGSHH